MRNDEFGERFLRLGMLSGMRSWELFDRDSWAFTVCAFNDGILHGGPRDSSSGVASVNGQYRARDETRRVGTKEHDDSGTVSRISPPFLRCTLEDLG